MSQLFTTPFGRHSTASEVIDGTGLSGKRAIVTGSGSGIGAETARALALAGAEVVLAVRRPQAAGQIDFRADPRPQRHPRRLHRIGDARVAPGLGHHDRPGRPAPALDGRR
jgi:NAD(P)-dependent dehydrogenase (short-subunit alcohol dehydrogenase family)